jgi:hypothetical protein
MASHVGAKDGPGFQDDEKIQIQDIPNPSMGTHAIGNSSDTNDVNEKPTTVGYDSHTASPAPLLTETETPRSSGSTSTSPHSFGRSIGGAADPLVAPPEGDDPRPTLTGRSLVILIA